MRTVLEILELIDFETCLLPIYEEANDASDGICRAFSVDSEEFPISPFLINISTLQHKDQIIPE